MERRGVTFKHSFLRMFSNNDCCRDVFDDFVERHLLCDMAHFLIVQEDPQKFRD